MVNSRPDVEAPAKAAPSPPFPMQDDRVIGDGGNVTVYERPDRSRYALDKRALGREWAADAPVFGRARFDPRALATGRWEGSRSASVSAAGTEANASGHRARRRGSRFRTG